MFRFTIRDLLWLMVVVALAVGLWMNHQHVRSLDQQIRQLKKESKVWEGRANSLLHDVMFGTNKFTDVEFIPDGIKYTPKKMATMSSDADDRP